MVDLPPAEGYSDAVFAGDIAALAGELGFDKITIVAQDFGPGWTQQLGRTQPELINKQILFNQP